MNHTDAVVPDAKDSSSSGLPHIPYGHPGLSNGLPVYGSKTFDAAGETST